jgi:hypothetical protein
MKKKSKVTAITHVSAGVQFEMRADGTMQLKFDFTQMPEPVWYYYADCLALRVDSDNQMAILSVGRSEGSNPRRFRDHVEIAMPVERLLVDFWKSARDLESTLDHVLKSKGWVEFPFKMEQPTGNVQTFYANVLFMAVGIGESSLDFYHLSPRQIHFAKGGSLQEMQVLPVIRVSMSTALSKRLLTEIAEHSPSQTSPQQEPNGVVHA